ncbi:MAG: hypothetical protein HZC36_14320 [Armatimonadetes bacterium]|nr:hypothetical protein [Armatimonadota bacterium]
MKKCLYLLAALVAACSVGAQGLTYVTNVRAMVDEGYDEIYVENDPDLKEASVAGTTGNAVARARIAPGINSAYAHWDSLNSTSPAATLMADSWTHWTDTVVISDPNLDGTVGHFTASLRVFGNAAFNLTGGYASGDIYSDAYVYGFWDSWIGTSTDGGGSFLVGGWFGDWHSDEFGDVWYSGDELNQPLTEVQLEFIYGQPFLLRMNLEAYFDAQNSSLLEGTVEGTLDFSHTAYWNGMGGIFDAQGNRVNPSFWSESGVDWRQGIVPEPSGAAALALGWLVLFALRRRTS